VSNFKYQNEEKILMTKYISGKADGDITFNARELIDELHSVDEDLYENVLDTIADSFGRLGTWSDDEEGNMILHEDEDFDAETFGAEMMMCIHCANEGKENPMFDYDMGGVSDCLGCGDTMCQEHYESDSHRGCEGFHAESKSMFGKDKKGKMYARRRNGRIITHNAESWNETDEDTMVTFLNYGLSVSPSDRVSDMLEDRDSNYDLPTLEWYLTRSLNGYGDWMTASFGKEDVDTALDMVHGRMGKETKYGYEAEHEGVYACSKCKHWNRNPVDGITKCKKCGNGTFAFVKKSEFMPDGDGNVVGQQTFGFNGTPLHAEEDTSFGLVGEGNNFGQMRAEGEEIEYECYECGREWTRNNGRGCPYGDPNCFLCDKHDHSDCDDPRQACDLCNQHSCERTDYPEDECDYPDLWEMENEQDFEADFSIERPFQTGVKLSAGLLTGAALFGLAGATLTALIGSMMDKGE
jgi:hypothetical protein